MENLSLIAALEQSYERMREKKIDRKQRREELKAECENVPAWKGWMEDKQEIGNKLKTIKLQVEESTGLGADIRGLTDEIKLEEDVIAGIITQLITSGEVENGKEFHVGDRTFTPKIKVNLNAQLRLL